MLYGLGTILGAGIYVLVGEVAARSGGLAPFSFVLSGVVAALTGLTFAELAARYPESAGEAVYVREAFGFDKLAIVVGLAIVTSGITSAAAITKGFIAYLDLFVVLPDPVGAGLFVGGLAFVTIAGVNLSVGAAASMTVIEVIGLLLVIVGGFSAIDPGVLAEGFSNGAETVGFSGLMAGSFLAFYAFIGFEDMVNVAEEVKDPTRVIPKALIVALSMATVLYVVVALVCLSVLTPVELAASEQPLAEVFAKATGSHPGWLGVIGLIAVTNGALVQVIMGSRVLYGLAKRGWLPRWVGTVSATTHTPWVAALMVSFIIWALASTFELANLGDVTSFVVLSVFTLVNAALIKLKKRPHDGFSVPLWVPWAGLVCNVCFLLFRFVGGG